MRRNDGVMEVFVLRFEEAMDRDRKRRLTADEAGELLGMSGRHFRRLLGRYDEDGAEGLRDRRLGKPSPRRAPLAELTRMQALYQERYGELDIRQTTYWPTAPSAIERRQALKGGKRVGLNLPHQRKPLQQIVQLQRRRLPPIQERLHDLRREQRQPQDPADVGRVDALGPGQILERRMHARVQHLPPPERPRQRLDHGVVDPRPKRSFCWDQWRVWR